MKVFIAVIYKVGIISGAPPELSEEIIIRGISCAEEVVDKVERISRIIDSDKSKIRVKTNLIKIFSKDILPSFLDLYGVFF